MWQQQRDIADFMTKAGQVVMSRPGTWPTKEAQALRLKLHEEEAVIELNKAQLAKNLEEVADSIIDSLVVIIGTACAYGIDIEPLWEKVHKANMAKFGPGGYKREDGKWMKPPGWVKPELLPEIIKQTEKVSVYA